MNISHLIVTSVTGGIAHKYECITGYRKRGEWSSGPASSISLTEVKHRCVRSETGWATFQMNDQNSSLCCPSEGTLN